MPDLVNSLSGRFWFVVEVSQAWNNDDFSLSEEKACTKLEEELLNTGKIKKTNLVMF